MKKIIFLLSTILVLQTCAMAQPTNLSFLYINGSNNNDKKMEDWYINGIKKLHPVIKKKFEQNAEIKRWTQKHNLIIDEEPEIFFWGYDSKTDLDFVKERINISKAFSSILAYEIRSLLTQFMHDAIWVQKTHNMLPILDNLNERIILHAKENKNVILYGYSAGSFVTYQYLLYKLPYINQLSLIKALNADPDIVKFVEENPRKRTCLSALSNKKGNVGTITNTGNIVLNQNKELLKENYLKMDEMTEKYCAPENSIKGVVNFASPIPLFYSDLADKNYEISYFNIYMTKYILEHGIYFLTINFREDPLGFPTTNNLTPDEIQSILNINLNNPTGVIYDNSGVWSRRPAFIAHTSYWSARNIFAKSIVEGFVEGTKFYYNPEYQQKILEKRKK